MSEENNKSIPDNQIIIDGEIMPCELAQLIVDSLEQISFKEMAEIAKESDTSLDDIAKASKFLSEQIDSKCEYLKPTPTPSDKEQKSEFLHI